MNRYEFTLTRDYVSSWTYIEAIRELLQNAYDYENLNPQSKAMVKISKSQHSIKISNKNDKVSIKDLLMGHGTKRYSSDQVGGFGEGFLLALLVLIRNGYEVFITNCNEVWTCSFEHSETFEEDLFVVSVTQEESTHKDFDIEIHGLLDSQIDTLKNKFLGLGSKYKSISTKYGEILVDPSQKGKMYVQGLPITEDVDFTYGYNFKPQYVKLDRDRKEINHRDLKNITALAIAYMEEYNFQLLDDLVQKGGSDVDYIVSKSIEVPDNFVSGYADYLKEKIGIKDTDVVVTETSNKIVTELKRQGENVVTVKKKIVEEVLNQSLEYSHTRLQEVSDKISKRDKIEEAWNDYKYSTYKTLRDWKVKYGKNLTREALSGLDDILESLEPYGFNLIKEEVLKREDELKDGKEQ